MLHVLSHPAGEEDQTVEEFVKENSEKMDYNVALDNETQSSDAYMAAYGRDGIPTAFVVDKQGRVVWVGHPGFPPEDQSSRRRSDAPPLPERKVGVAGCPPGRCGHH